MLRRSRSSLRITAIGTLLLGGIGTAGAMALSPSGPPAPRIVSGPGHQTLRRVATFHFSDAQRGVSFRCAINGGPFRACHSPARFSRRPLGRNVFAVEARTRSGATSSRARYVWIVRPPAPGLAISAPLANRYYNAASWGAICGARGGVCGTLRASRGRPSVRVLIRQLATGRYFNGRAYSSSRPMWARARLGRAHGGLRTWADRIGIPPRDGGYTVTVRLVRRLRAGTHALRRIAGPRIQTAVTFSLDTVAPPAPSIISGPANPSSATAATVRFSDAPGVAFQCALDGAALTGCTSPVTYTGLTTGTHRVSVWAVDEAGNRSGPAAASWQQVVASGQSAPFTISGQSSGPLYPGGAAQTIPLTLSNPGDENIYVTSLGATLEASGLPSGCSADGFQIRQPQLPAVGLLVPARTTVTLPTLALGAASIAMIDTGRNQDACQNASLPLVLNGSAHS